jgi:hypothetical protein
MNTVQDLPLETHFVRPAVLIRIGGAQRLAVRLA